MIVRKRLLAEDFKRHQIELTWLLIANKTGNPGRIEIGGSGLRIATDIQLPLRQ